jgi:hypothetical protein
MDEEVIELTASVRVIVERILMDDVDEVVYVLMRTSLISTNEGQELTYCESGPMTLYTVLNFPFPNTPFGRYVYPSTPLCSNVSGEYTTFGSFLAYNPQHVLPLAGKDRRPTLTSSSQS